MRYLLICVLCQYLALTGLQAQATDVPWQFGMELAVLQSTTPLPGRVSSTNWGGGPIGSGQQYKLWAAYALSARNELQLAAGYRMLSDYQWRVDQFSGSSAHPTHIRQIYVVNELLALQYLDMDLSWCTRLGSNSRWKLNVGLRTSWLIAPKGREITEFLVTGLNINNREQNTSVSDRFRVSRLDEQPLQRSDFAELDYGLNLGIAYEVTPGLDVQLGGYQGFAEVLGPSTGHRVRSFSLGFQARLF